VLGVAYGSLCALAQSDLRRFVAYASTASAGAWLFGIAAFTPQGMAGCVAGMFAHGLAVAILLGVAAALEERAGTSDLPRLAGLTEGAPLLGALLATGLALSLGVPGMAGFWGMLLVLLGGFARHPALSVLLASALVLSAAAHARVARQVLFARGGAARAAERPSGVLADVSARELAVLVPLAALALLLGVWPVPLLSQIADGARDASAAVEGAGAGSGLEPR
jgi:NADH-quinone oxidoreductase subunit M